MHTGIIQKLYSKTKPNITKISRELKITRVTFQNRFEQLAREHIIKNFIININPNISPNLKYIILEIKTNPKEPHLVEELQKIPQLKILDGIFGEFSLLTLFIFKDSNEFSQVLNIIDKIMSNSYFKKYQLVEAIRVYKTYGIELTKVRLDVNYTLDNIDYLILKILEEDQGLKLLSTFEISRILKRKYQIEISQSTIYNRIKNLEQAGIILNYAINFNPSKLGFKGKFFIRIKPRDTSKYNQIALKLEKMQEITHLFRIGEQYGLFAIVRVRNIEDYASFIKYLYDTEEIEDTFTIFVLDELKPYTNFKFY
ncbi:MAG: Lrp/AsnC family transcriptional regulator [Candidatus Lokiarchaeota archaeon]|nr:Lrp/AsnC family transcriptional regulator [Candidatus Lokiarchaeota archaeon]